MKGLQGSEGNVHLVAGDFEKLLAEVELYGVVVSDQNAGHCSSSSKQVFELDAGVGFGVAVLHDDGGVDADAPILAGAVGDGARAGDDNRAFGDYERLVVRGAMNGVAHQI